MTIYTNKEINGVDPRYTLLNVTYSFLPSTHILQYSHLCSHNHIILRVNASAISRPENICLEALCYLKYVLVGEW